MPMNYAYCRASTIIQETSCAVQEDMLRQQNDHPLDHVFTDEDTSGRVYPFLDREAAKQLMAVVKSGDHIWIYKIDRLGRNTVDILNTITMFMNRDVHVHVLDFGGQAMNIEGAMGFLLVAICAVFAEVEGKMISERTREALKYRRERGMPINAHSPYGMIRRKRSTANGHRAYDEWDEQECQDIREIYRRVREGREHLYQVAIDFAKQGRLTAKGKPWARPPKRDGGPWRDCRVRKSFNWYNCLRELGMDVESTAIHIATIFSSAWTAAGKPRNVASWRDRDVEGLEEFVALAQRPTP